MARLPDFTSLSDRQAQPARGVAQYRGTTGFEDVPGRVTEETGAIVRQAGNELGHDANVVRAEDRRQAEQTKLEQERLDTVKAEDGFNKLRQAQLALTLDPKGGFANLQGGDAIKPDVIPNYTQKFKDAGTQISASLDNDNQKRLFARRADVASYQYQGELLKHVAQQSEVYEKNVTEGTVSTEIQKAAIDPSNNNAFMASVTRANAAIESYGLHRGMAPDNPAIVESKRKALDGAYKARFESWRTTDPVGALKGFEEVAKDPAAMGADMRLHLQTQLFAAAAPVLANQLLQTGGPGATDSVLPKDVTPPTGTPTEQWRALEKSYRDGEPVARGVRNNNPGNIIKGEKPWQGEVPGSDRRYATFETPEAGVRAMGKTLLAYADTHGLNTVSDIVARWAPAADNNDPVAYAKTVATQMGVDANAKIDVHNPATMKTLVRAMVGVENGKSGAAISDQQIETGLNAALGAGNLPTPGEKQVAATGVNTGNASPNFLSGRIDPNVRTGNPIVDSLPADQKMHVLQIARTQANQEQAQYREQLKDRINDATASYLVTGSAPNAPTRGEFVQAFGQLEGSSRYRAMQDVAQTGAHIQEVRHLPDADITRILAQSQPLPGDGYAEKMRSYGHLVDAANQVRSARQADPVQYAISSGSYGLSPIQNLNDPAALTKELQKRAQTAPRIAQDYNAPVSILTKPEAQAMAAVIKSSPVDMQKQYLGAIYGGVQDMGLYRKTMQALAPDAPVLATAGIDQAMGHKMTDGRDVADLVLRGNAILNPPKREDGGKHEGGTSLIKMPKDDVMKQTFDAEVGNAFTGKENARDLYEQRARAIYASLSAEAGDFTGEVNTKRLKAAVALSTGGIEKYNGSSIVMPYGMATDTFKNQMVNRLAMLAPSAVGTTPDELVHLPLENAGDGRYYVRRGTGYIVSQDGRPLTVDFNYAPPMSASYAPPAVPPVRRGVIPKPGPLK